MRETRPRNLKEMLVEAKNTSELMVDLSYAAIFYNAETLSEEVSDVLRAGDVIFLQGPPEGVAEVRELAGAHPLADALEPAPPAGQLSEIDRAVDILIEMKNLSEVAVRLAYSALLYDDAGLAREVIAIEDEMRYRLERWVLLVATHVEDSSRLRGLLHLATASETIADCAMEVVWVVEKGEEVHPVLSAAIGESDEVVLKLTVSPGSPADDKTLGSLEIETEMGMYALAVNRGGDTYRLRGGDSLLVTGAPEGLEPLLAGLFGQDLEGSP
jgi:uncharacterized protein with PhoU and TrkA domain